MGNDWSCNIQLVCPPEITEPDDEQKMVPDNFHTTFQAATEVEALVSENSSW